MRRLLTISGPVGSNHVILPGLPFPPRNERREKFMPDSSPAREPEIYVPTGDDRDPGAEAQMQMGKAHLDENNALHDPWFESAEHALSWTPDEPDEDVR
jgi:hypothetical protein